MRRAILAITALLIAIGIPLSAVELGLEDILAMAEKNNKIIKLAQLEVQSASAEKAAAYASAFPSINANFGYNRELLEQEVIPFIPGYDNQLRIDTTLDQILFDMRVMYAIQAARSLNQYSQDQYEAVRQSVITDVKKTFYQVLLLNEVYEVARDSETSAEDNFKNIKLRFESGTVSEFDLLQAEVNWQNTIPDRIKARRNFEVALNNLKTLVGLSLEEQIKLVGSLEEYPEIPEEVGFSQLLAQRPDLRALEWEKKLNEINVKVQKAGYFPTLNANLIYSAFAGSDKLKWENDSYSLVFGLQINIPIFSGGNTKASVSKAQTAVENVTTRIGQAYDAVRVEMSNIRLSLEDPSQRIDAAGKNVDSAYRAYEIAETRVENQLTTQVELKEIRVALNQAQVNYFSAIFDYLSAYFDWQQAVGAVTNTAPSKG
jgi:outer membrane protein TolC